MRLQAFNIKNFRSIVNTGWCPFSRDHVTVLVGQNESGKSSILEALHCLLSGISISEDDLRAASPLPEMDIRCEFSAQELIDAIDEKIGARFKKMHFTVTPKDLNLFLN